MTTQLLHQIIGSIVKTLDAQDSTIKTTITIDGKRHNFEKKSGCWYVNKVKIT